MSLLNTPAAGFLSPSADAAGSADGSPSAAADSVSLVHRFPATSRVAAALDGLGFYTDASGTVLGAELGIASATSTAVVKSASVVDSVAHRQADAASLASSADSETAEALADLDAMITAADRQGAGLTDAVHSHVPMPVKSVRDCWRSLDTLLDPPSESRRKARDRHQQALARARYHAAHHGGDGDGDDDTDAPASSPPPRRDEGGVKPRMPCQNELASLPYEVAETLEGTALNTMRHLLYPTVFARCRRRQRDRASKAAHRRARAVTPSLLRSLYRGFEHWPEDALARLVSAMSFEHFGTREYVVHAGEPPACGAYVVVSGTVTSVNPWTSQRRTLSAPFIVGGGRLLDGEPYKTTHITATECDTWQLSEGAFQAVFETLTAPVVDETIRIAFDDQNRRLAEHTPMTADIMRRSPIFAACPANVLTELARFAVPHCVPRLHVLCRGGLQADTIVFPVSGSCKAVPVDGAPTAAAAQPGASASVGVMRAKTKSMTVSRAGSTVSRLAPTTAYNPHARLGGKAISELPGNAVDSSSVFGDDSVLTNGRNDATLVTMTPTACYILKKGLFDSAIRVSAGVPDALHAAFRLQRERAIDATRALVWGRHVATLPFVADLLPPQEIAASLSCLFRPRVFSPLAVVCSTGEYAATAFMVLRGRVKVGEGREHPRLTVGDWAGFTGVVRHRWAAPAIAETLVEVIEVRVDLLAAWLRDHGAYEEVKARALRLMFPVAFPRSESAAAAALVAGIRAPPLHPVSRQRQLSRSHQLFLQRADAAPGFDELVADHSSSSSGGGGGGATQPTPTPRQRRYGRQLLRSPSPGTAGSAEFSRPLDVASRPPGRRSVSEAGTPARPSSHDRPSSTPTKPPPLARAPSAISFTPQLTDLSVIPMATTTPSKNLPPAAALGSEDISLVAALGPATRRRSVTPSPNAPTATTTANWSRPQSVRFSRRCDRTLDIAPYREAAAAAGGAGGHASEGGGGLSQGSPVRAIRRPGTSSGLLMDLAAKRRSASSRAERPQSGLGAMRSIGGGMWKRAPINAK